MAPRPPLPPFTEETARQKVQAAEDAWNTRDPERVAARLQRGLGGATGTVVTGRAEIVESSDGMGPRTRLRPAQGPVVVQRNRIAVRYQYESHDASGQWYRSYGNSCGSSGLAT